MGISKSIFDEDTKEALSSVQKVPVEQGVEQESAGCDTRSESNAVCWTAQATGRVHSTLTVYLYSNPRSEITLLARSLNIGICFHRHNK